MQPNAILMLSAFLFSGGVHSAAELLNEIPQKFVQPTENFDHVRRTVMIPMRDGVKLNTVIIVPKGVKNAPMLLTRTPYNAAALTSHSSSSHLGPTLQGYDNAADVIVEDGYIRVVQDVRGKHDSEGDYMMNRPLIGPLNPTKVDHSTDAYDTIDWLVKNVPESNGKVGLIGISYNGFTTLMGLFNPHPALKVAVPMNPMVDCWIGDDCFHYGAFRQGTELSYFLAQEGAKGDTKWVTSFFDDYDTFMKASCAGQLARDRGIEQTGYWRKLLQHPTYDSYWQSQAVDKILAKQPLKVPMMIVHSLWDAEDIYGAIAVYKAVKPLDTKNDKVFLVIGPWKHGGAIGDGSSLGPVKFNSDTALHWRQEILRPFLARYLKDEKHEAISQVNAFETGTNKWRTLKSWPGKVVAKPLYFAADQKLTFDATMSNAGFEEYISDPMKPVPYRRRPIPQQGYDESKGLTWPIWLVDDQRETSGRTDVATFASDILTAPTKISGEPKVHLVASTSGTDSDWVVKIIDVYPDEVAGQSQMGGYQLMISGNIFRGRYRESLEIAKPLEPGKPLAYEFALPTVHHVFLPGHRIMVQVHSSWFPLYDRNPQKFVENIFWTKPEDFQKATQRIYYGAQHGSNIEMPVSELTKQPKMD